LIFMDGFSWMDFSWMDFSWIDFNGFISHG
jgi:hypothetical protein